MSDNDIEQRGGSVDTVPPIDGRDIKWYKDWQVTSASVDRFGDIVQSTVDSSTQEDAAVAIAALGLLTTLSEEDNRTYFYMDAADRLDHGQGNLPSDILQAYNLRATEINEIATRLHSNEERPIPHFRRGHSGSLSSTASLEHFSDLALILLDDTRVKLVMGPTGVGGYNSVAYPIRYVEITADPAQPLSVDFDNYSFPFHHEISKELPQHPAITTALKGRFTEIVKMNTNNRDEFKAKRQPDGRNGDMTDPTQLLGFLFNFVGNTYLRDRLPHGEYNAFHGKVSDIVTPWHAAAVARKLTPGMERDYSNSYYTEMQKGLERVRGVRPSVH